MYNFYANFTFTKHSVIKTKLDHMICLVYKFSALKIRKICKPNCTYIKHICTKLHLSDIVYSVVEVIAVCSKFR